MLHLYYSDETKEVKIAKMESLIAHVKGTLKNEMENWKRKEYEGVLASYEEELALISK